MQRIRLATALLLSTTVWGWAGAQPITGNSPLRDIQVPGMTPQVPGAAFQESAAVKQHCMPDSNFPPIRDKAGRNYQRQAEWRQLMQQGLQISQVSYNWARALNANVQIQRQLPSAGTNAYNMPARATGEQRLAEAHARARGRPLPQASSRVQPAAPQQADLDYNFAVLEAAQAEIETATNGHLANRSELFGLMLNDLASSNRPLAEMPDLLGQFDRFEADIAVCVSQRRLGREALQALAPSGEPGIRVSSLMDNSALKEQKERRNLAEVRAQEGYMQIADRVIADRRPTLLGRIQPARSEQELRGLVPALFGNERLALMARDDAEIKQALAARSKALEAEAGRLVKVDGERRTAAEKARIVAAIKSNAPPTLPDVQAAVLAASMEMSAQKQALQGAQISPTRYQLLGMFGGKMTRQREITIEVSDLVCRPQGGKHSCSYTESFSWRKYVPILLIPEPVASAVLDGGREKSSGQFVWSAEGLAASRSGTGPMVGFLDMKAVTIRVEVADPSRPSWKEPDWRQESRLTDFKNHQQFPLSTKPDQ